MSMLINAEVAIERRPTSNETEDKENDDDDGKESKTLSDFSKSSFAKIFTVVTETATRYIISCKLCQHT